MNKCSNRAELGLHRGIAGMEFGPAQRELAGKREGWEITLWNLHFRRFLSNRPVVVRYRAVFHKSCCFQGSIKIKKSD